MQLLKTIAGRLADRQAESSAGIYEIARRDAAGKGTSRDADELPALLDLTRAGHWQDMPKIVTDEMLEKFVLRASYVNIAEVYRERYTGLTRRITFPIPADPGDGALAAEVIASLKQ